MVDRAAMIPGLVTVPAGGAPAGVAGGAGPVAGWVRELDYAHVDELRARVANRLATDEQSVFSRLDDESRTELIRTLVIEELQQWVLHRQALGQPVPTEPVEDQIIDATVAATGGLGRLQPLLERTDVEDIFFSGPYPTMLRLASGEMVEGPAIGSSNDDVMALMKQISSTLGGASRDFSPAQPLLAVRLKAVGELGARLSGSIDVVPMPAGTIRIHRHADSDLDTLASIGMIDAPLRAFLRAVVHAQGKIAISGGTGYGKTTVLRSLAAEIPHDRMIVTIEDDRELGLHVLKRKDAAGRVVTDAQGRAIPRRPPALVRAYEARPANSEGRGEITMEHLGKQALRDSPDVIIFGEARGGEVVQLLEGVTNGVGGVMFTLHAESAEGVFDRVVQLVRKAHPPLPADYALRALTFVDLIVQVRRDRRHRRFVSEVIEVASGPLGENGYPRFQRIFAPGPDGRAIPTGHHLSPALASRLEDVGFDVSWLRPEQSDWPDWDGDAPDGGGRIRPGPRRGPR